jgi:hypothetical protein
LLPLIESPTPATWRTSAIEEQFKGTTEEDSTFTSWKAIRTDESHPAPSGAWHYVEWGNGFRELYDLEADPWELVNLADDPSKSVIKEQLATQLEALWQENRPASEVMRPDVLLGKSAGGVFYGSHIYNNGPTTSQIVRYTNVPSTSQRSFFVQVLNRSTNVGAFNVRTSSWGSTAMAATYLRNGVDVTADITSPSGLTVTNVAPGRHLDLVIKITATDAPNNVKRVVSLTARNAIAPDKVDVVKAIMSR